MAGELHIGNDQFQYIARISHGKDSLKMLDVIVSRGLRLDRITTTDIWATDTIRGEHPKMVKFKEIADEFIWQKYHIEVEHLCAMRNGQKVTYEKLFYHIPKRRNAGGGQLSAKSGLYQPPMLQAHGHRRHRLVGRRLGARQRQPRPPVSHMGGDVHGEGHLLGRGGVRRPVPSATQRVRQQAPVLPPPLEENRRGVRDPAERIRRMKGD